MSEHTPTPWKVFDTDFGPKIYTVQGDGAAVCQFFPFHEKGRNPADAFLNAEANAALIVRSVNTHAQLVAALEDCVAALRLTECPRPGNTREEGFLAPACVEAGECGCCYAAYAEAVAVLAGLKEAGAPVPQLDAESSKTLRNKG